MSTSALVTTRREPGQPERRNPAMGKQPLPKLRAQIANMPRQHRAAMQVFKNNKWAKGRLARINRLTKVVKPATPAA
jgi:hypothetical protein